MYIMDFWSENIWILLAFYISMHMHFSIYIFSKTYYRVEYLIDGSKHGWGTQKDCFILCSLDPSLKDVVET
jgi:hypothetical protein